MRSLILALAVLGATGCKDSSSTKPADPATPPPPTTTLPAEASMPAPTPPPPAPPADPAATQAIARQSNQFALALWSKLPAATNLAVSPASIATALTIAWGGAKGETAAQLKKLLQLDGDEVVLLQRWGDLYKSLSDGSRSGLTLKLANRLYGEKTYPFDTTYFTIVRHAFDVWIEPVDFVGDADGMRQKINTWVATQTEQRIKDLLGPGAVNPATRMVIVNAIYFLADWKTPFDVSATKPRPFFASGTTQKQVPTMVQQGAFRYAKTDGAALVELPYKNDAAQMFVVLPDKRDGLAALEAKLERTLRALQSAMQLQQVLVQLPRFTIDPPAPMEIKQMLQALGMTDAFEASKADFTGIAKPKSDSDKLYISGVIHKAFVKVDEKGTEAAAATALSAPGGGPPPKPVTFAAEHPFLFVIVDRTTGMILFMGRVVDPA